jgi:hypothetical protein
MNLSAISNYALQVRHKYASASFQIFVSGEKVLATQYISADVERHRVETKIFVSAFSRKFCENLFTLFAKFTHENLKC